MIQIRFVFAYLCSASIYSNTLIQLIASLLESFILARFVTALLQKRMKIVVKSEDARKFSSNNGSFLRKTQS